MKNFRAKVKFHRPLITQILLVCGLVLAFYVNDRTSHKLDRNTRDVICLILVQSDATTYAEVKSGLITLQQAEAGLEITARFRQELGPAPHCYSHITSKKQAPPFHVPPLPAAPKH